MIEIPEASPNLRNALYKAFNDAEQKRIQFYTPEDLLWGIGWQRQFMMVTGDCRLTHTLTEYFLEHSMNVPEDIEYAGPVPSNQFVAMMDIAYAIKGKSNAQYLDVPHVLKAILELENSYAHDVLEAATEGDEAEFMSKIIDIYSDENLEYADGEDETQEMMERFAEINNLSESDFFEEIEGNASPGEKKSWRQYVSCLNDMVGQHNPLVGRESELERTMLVLCRRDKNNPLYVGEAGVGKTAIAYGLAEKIERGEVPQRLKGCRIYEVDMTAILAGTQYRGEFEKRLKRVLNGVAEEGNAILYFDEAHNIVGAGRVEGSTIDASNIFKPYLERGDMRFMGSTTYDEYKAVTASKAFARRFEKIDVSEPSIDECKRILAGVQQRYADYHGVTFTSDAIDYAVEASAKYISGRFLPDKAIDLIDEAGAWLQMHPREDGQNQVDKKLVSEVLARVCNVDMLAEDSADLNALGSLSTRILQQIYGQDQAVQEVTEAVEMATAGLTDEHKPMASLLFVGPTGVGKTEIARVLSKELNLPLLRYDMSEYAEKHAVAKLIGSPAGYVGYDDGGLLTDAVRKQPHCVLLLDEIEKAHSDIYNILLQIMDYAMLTDNKGNKADFRHVILIMTTNAGAQLAKMAGVGFAQERRSGQAMLKGVKQTFKPEFLNRLTAITVFNDIDEHMASLILDKKLRQLQEKLTSRGVTLHMSENARAQLMREGFSPEYGGREIERVVNHRIKPLLMREILYGTLRNGGEAHIDYADDKFVIA